MTSTFNTPVVDGSSGYQGNGAVTALRATIAFTDTVAKTLFTLPAGAVVVQQIYNVTTAFNAGTLNALSVGTSGTVDRFGSITVASLGLVTSGVVVTEIGNIQGTAATTVQGLYAYTGGSPTTGAANIVWLISFP